MSHPLTPGIIMGMICSLIMGAIFSLLTSTKLTGNQHQGTCQDTGQSTNNSLISQSQSICQDTGQSTTSAINNLPGELLLEIFDYYRYAYDQMWRRRHAWVNLAHVCRKWRAVMFASSSRLDLSMTVGPEKPSHFKEVRLNSLPIRIDLAMHSYEDRTERAFQRMHTAFKFYRDCVRKISFRGNSADFDKFFKATNFPFPVLESLVLDFKTGNEAKLPDTFLRGPKPSDLHLQRLRFEHATLASVFGFLSSATALTDLSLEIDTVFGSSPEASFLACLQGMPCLRTLRLSIPKSPKPSDFPLRPSTPGDVVPLSKLTCFYYDGHHLFLDNLLSGMSAPSLRDGNFSFSAAISLQIIHLPRFIGEVEERYDIAQINITLYKYSISLLTRSKSTSNCKRKFELHSSRGRFPVSMEMSSALSTRLATVEELHVNVIWPTRDTSYNAVSWRRMFRHFPSIRVLHVKGTKFYDYIAGALQEFTDLALLPALEEIELGNDVYFIYESGRANQLREQAGRPVKVFTKK